MIRMLDRLLALLDDLLFAGRRIDLDLLLRHVLLDDVIDALTNGQRNAERTPHEDHQRD